MCRLHVPIIILQGEHIGVNMQLPSPVIIFHTCIWLMEDTEHRKKKLTDYTV